MKTTKYVFGIYALIIGLVLVGIASQLSTADNNLTADQRGILPTVDSVMAETIPTRTPSAGQTVPTRTPVAGETIPTRTPAPGETIPTRTPAPGETIPTRTPSPENSADSKADAPSRSGDQGSQIVLQSASADADDWVTVEWLAGDGQWYEVDGWRGNIHNGELIWWVSDANLGQGMFRWVVYADQSQAAINATSEPFRLPETKGIERSFSLDW
ncbi:MAG: hypothetical protein AAGD96_04475 [Chloroflexota bacterium]